MLSMTVCVTAVGHDLSLGARSRAAFMLASGEAARLPNEHDPLNECEFLAVASLGGNNLKGNRNVNIFLAAPLAISAVVEFLPHLVRHVFAMRLLVCMSKTNRRLAAVKPAASWPDMKWEMLTCCL